PFSTRLMRSFFYVGSLAALLVLGVGSFPKFGVFLVPLFGLVILGAAGAAGGLASFLSQPGLVLLGDASYSIYILQLPLLWWWQWVGRKILSHAAPPLVELVCFFGFVCAVSVASYLWI